MSLTEVSQDELFRQARLLEYANTKRNAADFNDVTIQVGAERIAANRMVLACYSKFFESMFLSQLRERYQNTVEVKEFDGPAIKAIIDFIYTGKIDIDANNVMVLLSAADFLQVDDVKNLCFGFLETSLTVDNCFDAVKASVLYNSTSSLKQTYQFISDNFDELFRADNFKALSKHDLFSILSKVNRKKVQETSLYTAIVTWVKHHQTREAEFPSFFLILELSKMSVDFVLDTVAQEPLVKSNIACLNVAFSYLSAKIRHSQNQQNKATKILCFGGRWKNDCLEVYNLLGESLNRYSDLPHQTSYHCALSLDNFVYCLGGAIATPFKATSTAKVYRLNIKAVNSQWEEIASMSEERCTFGAATWNGKLVVTGGDKYNGQTGVNSAELYEPHSNIWKQIALMNDVRSRHALVVADNKLFAVGGRGVLQDYLSSVEQLDNVDGQWKFVKSMNEERRFLAVVSCDDFIYAIGGFSSGGALKTVEKYDLSKDEWSFVASMNVQRQTHAACVLDGKIYVVGGWHKRTIECYDPARDEWTVVGETYNDFSAHAIVAV